MNFRRSGSYRTKTRTAAGRNRPYVKLENHCGFRCLIPSTNRQRAAKCFRRRKRRSEIDDVEPSVLHIKGVSENANEGRGQR